MGNSRGPVDRAHPLYQLSQAVARGASQVLQRDLRGCAPRQGCAAKEGEREWRDCTGERLDLTARCEECGEALPELAPNGAQGRSDRKFCSKKCRNDQYNRLEAQSRLEAKRDRPPCAWCGEPIAPEKFSTAIYCCEQCRLKATYRRGREALVRTCPTCGKSFNAYHPDRQHCSRACYDKTRLRNHPRPCQWCGDVIERPKAVQKFCSQSCGAKTREKRKRRKAGKD